MAMKGGSSSFSCVASSLSTTPFRSRRSSQLSLSQGSGDQQQYNVQQLRYAKDLLILFFTEALFYRGVAVYLMLIDHLWRPVMALSAANSSKTPVPQLGDRISSVTVLVLSLIIPMVTMGLV